MDFYFNTKRPGVYGGTAGGGADYTSEQIRRMAEAIQKLKDELLPHVILTQEEYEALESPEPDTLYLIKDS